MLRGSNLNSTSLIAVRASGGPPGTGGGAAVILRPLVIGARSIASVWFDPPAWTSSMSWSLALKSVTSVTNGSSGDPLMSVMVPAPTFVSAGQASLPCAYSSVSVASHRGIAAVSIREPSGRSMTFSLTAGGLPSGFSGSRWTMRSVAPVAVDVVCLVKSSVSSARPPPGPTRVRRRS